MQPELRYSQSCPVMDNRKIDSTFFNKDNLPAPHQGYNKGYKASASTLVGFRSTFAAKESENDQYSLVYWLSYAVIRMIHVCLTTGQAWFYSQR